MKISKRKFEKLLEKACEIYVNNEYKESLEAEEENTEDKE